VAWIVRLVKTVDGGEELCVDVMKINRPDDLDHISSLGLTLADGKLLLAGLQQEIVAAQTRGHAVRRPDCRNCGGVCHVKDYRDHAVATLFGQVTVRLPRFRCAGCGGNETGHGWPSHCRSTPELDQLQAHLCALMPYRVAADVLEQMFPVDAGKDVETLRRHALKIGGAVRMEFSRTILSGFRRRHGHPPWVALAFLVVQFCESFCRRIRVAAVTRLARLGHKPQVRCALYPNVP